jgi:hypothetical protein
MGVSRLGLRPVRRVLAGAVGPTRRPVFPPHDVAARRRRRWARRLPLVLARTVVMLRRGLP